MVSKFKLCGLLIMIMIHISLNTQMVNDNVEHWSAESDGIEVWNKFLTLSSSQQRPPLSLKQKACDPYSCLCHAELHSTANATWERVIVKKNYLPFLYIAYFSWSISLSFAIICSPLCSIAMPCNVLSGTKTSAKEMHCNSLFWSAHLLSGTHSLKLSLFPIENMNWNFNWGTLSLSQWFLSWLQMAKKRKKPIWPCISRCSGRQAVGHQSGKRKVPPFWESVSWETDRCKILVDSRNSLELIKCLAN